MATTGQIHFTRERTVASQERELQETKVADSGGSKAASHTARANGWSAVMSHALRTAAGGISGGCAVVVRSGIGIGAVAGERS